MQQFLTRLSLIAWQQQRKLLLISVGISMQLIFQYYSLDILMGLPMAGIEPPVPVYFSFGVGSHGIWPTSFGPKDADCRASAMSCPVACHVGLHEEH